MMESRRALIERTEMIEVIRITTNASANMPTLARLRNCAERDNGIGFPWVVPIDEWCCMRFGSSLIDAGIDVHRIASIPQEFISQIVPFRTSANDTHSRYGNSR